MGSLSLSLSNPQVTWQLGEGSWSGAGWFVSWTIWFDRCAEVEVASGGNLRDMPASLILKVGKMKPEPEREEDKELMSFERGGHPIGLVTFVPAYGPSSDGVIKAQSDSYEATLLLSEAELEAMISKVLAGQGPRRVRLNVPQFKYGWAPDGSHQTWDNTEKQWTKIDGATFVFGDEEQDGPEQDEEVLLSDPSEPPHSHQRLRRLPQSVARSADMNRMSSGFWL